MQAQQLAQLLNIHPKAKVTLSVSNEHMTYFADVIIEVTSQGKQITIVADITDETPNEE